MVADNRKLREAGWGCLAAWQASSSIRSLTYAVLARERPSVENSDPNRIDVPGGDWNMHSFFGGHAANAVACATFWNSRFKMGIAEPVLYGAAAAISLGRMTDRRHWASDTWVGMAAGYAMGRSIAARYARRESRREREKRPSRSHVAPRRAERGSHAGRPRAPLVGPVLATEWLPRSGSHSVATQPSAISHQLNAPGCPSSREKHPGGVKLMA